MLITFVSFILLGFTIFAFIKMEKRSKIILATIWLLSALIPSSISTIQKMNSLTPSAFINLSFWVLRSLIGIYCIIWLNKEGHIKF